MPLAKSAVHPFFPGQGEDTTGSSECTHTHTHTHRLGTHPLKLEGTRILHNFGVKGGPGTKI